MTIEDIRKLLHADPFRPFQIHCADGGRLVVKHEDFVALSPTGREFIVYGPQAEDSYQIVDVTMVTRVAVGGRNGTRRSH